MLLVLVCFLNDDVALDKQCTTCRAMREAIVQLRRVHKIDLSYERVLLPHTQTFLSYECVLLPHTQTFQTNAWLTYTPAVFVGVSIYYRLLP